MSFQKYQPIVEFFLRPERCWSGLKGYRVRPQDPPFALACIVLAITLLNRLPRPPRISSRSRPPPYPKQATFVLLPDFRIASCLHIQRKFASPLPVHGGSFRALENHDTWKLTHYRYGSAVSFCTKLWYTLFALNTSVVLCGPSG